MKHQWYVRRELKPYLDGQQRWDRAYQYLLRWTPQLSADGESFIDDPGSTSGGAS